MPLMYGIIIHERLNTKEIDGKTKLYLTSIRHKHCRKKDDELET
jgi:hypothetical protein